jgi:hypothetical protein
MGSLPFDPNALRKSDDNLINTLNSAGHPRKVRDSLYI